MKIKSVILAVICSLALISCEKKPTVITYKAYDTTEFKNRIVVEEAIVAFTVGEEKSFEITENQYSFPTDLSLPSTVESFTQSGALETEDYENFVMTDERIPVDFSEYTLINHGKKYKKLGKAFNKMSALFAEYDLEQDDSKKVELLEKIKVVRSEIDTLKAETEEEWTIEDDFAIYCADDKLSRIGK